MTPRSAPRGRTATELDGPAPSEPAVGEHGARPGRPRRAEVDQAILEAAVRLLSDHGFEGVTMEGVASEAGVGKATVYRRWPSKNELILDTIRSLKPMAAHPDFGDVRTDLVVMATGALTWGGDDALAPVMAALMSELQRNPELAQVYREQFLAPRRAESLRILQRGVERGEIRPDVDLDLALDTIIGVVVYRNLISGGSLDERIAEAAVDQLLDGISTPS